MPYNIMEVDGVPPINNRFPVDIKASFHDLAGPEHQGQLIDSQIPAFIMRDEEHQHDPHIMLIDGRDVSVDGAKLDTIETGAEVNNLSDQQAASLTSGTHSSWHHHDDWYYRKSELFQPGQSTVNWLNLIGVPTEFPAEAHIHDDRYYTEDEIDTFLNNYYTMEQFDNGQLNNLYYTEEEVDNFFTQYYSKTDLDDGQLDSRYYTENEVNTILNSYYSKTELDAGQLDNRYFTETEITTNYYDKNQVDAIIAGIETFGIKAGVDTYADLPGTETDGAIYIVRQTVGNNEEGFYKYDGGWIFLSRNTGNDIGSHNELQNLNTGDYLHLTAFEYVELTGGINTNIHNHDDHYYTEAEIDNFLDNIAPSSHNHDDRYYTESELGTLLLGKSNTDHIHDDRYFTELEITSNYYTKNQLNTGQLDNRYYTETEINNLLNQKSDITHTHDDLYYEKSVIDGMTSMYSLNTHLHDDRYYQESEVDALVATKAPLSHIHDERYYTETELGNDSGISGASRIGVSLIGGITANNVQDALQEIKDEVSASSNTLNEAYHAGRIITADVGPVQINATDEAPLQLTNMSSAPTNNLAAGQMTIINNELYIFNIDKNKWLTPTKFITFGKDGAADGHIINMVGHVKDVNAGYKMIKNGTMVSATLHSTNTQNGKNLSIRLNGSNVYTITTDIDGEVMDSNINIDFNAGDYISILSSSKNDKVEDPVIVLEIAWRM